MRNSPVSATYSRPIPVEVDQHPGLIARCSEIIVIADIDVEPGSVAQRRRDGCEQLRRLLDR
jgi:hypothetical protein